MSSLIRKALSIRQRLRTQAGEPLEDVALAGEKGISSEDRNKILVEINNLVAKHRIEIKPGTFSFASQRSGAFMPVIVNVAAVLVLLVSGIVLLYLFDLREESIVKPAQIQTAESEILEALKKESEQKLREKELQISDIQERLRAMRAEKDTIAQQAEERIREKEEEIRRTLEAELSAQRQKMINQGDSQQTIDQFIRTMEEERRAALENELALLKEQIAADRAEKEAAANASIEAYEKELRDSLLDRSNLQREWDSQRADLQRRIQEGEQALEAERNRIATELEAARKRQEQESLALKTILSFYESVNQNLKSQNYDGAIGELDNLEGYINQPPVAGLEVIQQRRQVEVFLIGSLRTLIKNQRTLKGRELESLSAQAELIDAISEIVEKGDRSFDAGDMDSARRLYRSALDKIATIRRSYTGLQRIEAISVRLQSQELAQRIAEGDAFYTADEYQESVNSYLSALNYLSAESETVRRMMDRILDMGYKIGIKGEEGSLRSAQDLIRRAEETENKKYAVLERLRSLRETYALGEEESSAPIPREKLISLLKTKVLVKEILDSDAVWSIYPDIYNQMEEYLKALSEEQRILGYGYALSDITTLINALRGGESESDLEEVRDRGEQRANGDAFSRLLESLRTLFE